MLEISIKPWTLIVLPSIQTMIGNGGGLCEMSLIPSTYQASVMISGLSQYMGKKILLVVGRDNDTDVS
jgi:hypothetical protein